MIKKGVISLVLAAFIVFGVATAASADPWKNEAHGKKWKFKQPKPVKVNVKLVDIKSHWAEKSINSMASWGMISGYEDFTFKPNATVSKHEALMMIARASGYEADKNLSWNNILEDMIDYAVDEGILTEDESEDLAGWQPAKRYEVAVWAVRAMGLEEDNDELFFSDTNEIPAYARTYVSSMYRCQYMVGYPGKIFAPNKPVTRAELAAIIYKILDQGPVGDDDSDDSSTDEVEISSLGPADGSDNVEIDIDKLTAKFNVEIEAVDTLADVKDGIEIRSEDGDVVDIDEVSIDGRYLNIELDEELEEDTTYKVTIEDDIIKDEDSDEIFEGLSGSQWEFTTVDEDEAVEIERLDPENGEEDVDWEDTNVLRATFNCDIDADSLVDAVVVYNKDDNEEVDIDTVQIDGDELIITLGEELESNDTYEVTIKDGYFSSEESGEEFEGLDGEDWSFTTN